MCGNLEKNVKSLEIQILKDQHNSHHNCTKFTGHPNTINDDKLEGTIIEVCKDVNVDVSEMDIQTTYKTQCN